MDKKFLEKYLNSLSPTGFENESQQIWIDYMKQYVDDIIIDNYGTAVGVIRTPIKHKDKTYKVVVDAHVDEVSFRVKYISDKGYLYVSKNGGVDHQIAPSKMVNIHTKNGMVEGFFGWPAIHTRGAGTKETHPSIENIFIDVGVEKKEELEDMGIHVGCLVTYPDKFKVINDKFYTGKALDDKLGGFILTQIAKEIREKNIKLPYDLYIVNSVQEEVGLRGAGMIVETIRPDVAIVIDATHDTSSPLMNKSKRGDIRCGKGPVLTYGPTIQQKLGQLIEDVAISEKIDFQRKVSGRGTGTNTDSFAYSTGGVPSALISIPIKYMHTTVETAFINDVIKTKNLLLSSLQQINHNHNFKYLNV